MFVTMGRGKNEGEKVFRCSRGCAMHMEASDQIKPWQPWLVGCTGIKQ